MHGLQAGSRRRLRLGITPPDPADTWRQSARRSSCAPDCRPRQRGRSRPIPAPCARCARDAARPTLVTALTVAVVEAAEEMAAQSPPTGGWRPRLVRVLDDAANVCRWRELAQPLLVIQTVRHRSETSSRTSRACGDYDRLSSSSPRPPDRDGRLGAHRCRPGDRAGALGHRGLQSRRPPAASRCSPGPICSTSPPSPSCSGRLDGTRVEHGLPAAAPRTDPGRVRRRIPTQGPRRRAGLKVPPEAHPRGPGYGRPGPRSRSIAANDPQAKRTLRGDHDEMVTVAAASPREEAPCATGAWTATSKRSIPSPSTATTRGLRWPDDRRAARGNQGTGHARRDASGAHSRDDPAWRDARCPAYAEGTLSVAEPKTTD